MSIAQQLYQLQEVDLELAANQQHQARVSGQLGESQEVARVNAPGSPMRFRLTDEDQYDVIISTGPPYKTQREEGAVFVDMMVSNLQNLPLDPMSKSKLLALMVRLKGLGPVGDEMIKILDPMKAQGGHRTGKLLAGTTAKT